MPYLCSPALIYIAFVSTQIIIDIFKKQYRSAFYKLIIMIIITILLNVLCQRDMSVVSWIIVFIPFIFTTYATLLLIYLFGYNLVTGDLINPQTNSSVQYYKISTQTPEKQQPNTVKSVSFSTSSNVKTPYVDTYSDPSYQSGWYRFGLY